MKKIFIFGNKHIKNLKNIEENLLLILTKKINQGFLYFAVCEGGDFKNIACKILGELKNKYSKIEYYIVNLKASFLEKNEIFFLNTKQKYLDLKQDYKKFIDSFDCFICYVSPSLESSKPFLYYSYIIKTNKKIINLYKNSQSDSNIFYDEDDFNAEAIKILSDFKL